MKTILCLLLFLLPPMLKAQNLVLNPSFEETDHCLTESDVSKYSNVPSLLLSECRNWASFSGEGTADLFQPCNSWRPMSSVLPPSVRTGVAYAGFYAFDRPCCETEYREYLVGKLKSPLEKGKNYEVSFWVLLHEKSVSATSSLGVYLSRDTLYRLDNFYGVAPFIPQLQNPKGDVLSNKEKWTEVLFKYKAQGEEQYIMIGNFLDDEQSEVVEVRSEEKQKKEAYYYIDDVCVSAQNCSIDIVLPRYGFRAMVYENGTNSPLTGVTTEMIPLTNPAEKQSVKTENDARARFSLTEKKYMCFVNADCYLPKMEIYNIPLVVKGEKLPEQLQYFPMVKLEKGAKLILESDISYTIEETLNKNKDRLDHFFLRLDKMAEYIKANPTLKVSLNAGVNFGYMMSEEKKTNARAKHATNLEYIKNYWLGKGVKSSQFSTKIIEFDKDHISISGEVDGFYVSKSGTRYELEILETSCKATSANFFDKKEKGAIYILDKVFFAPDSPELEKRSFQELDKLSLFLKQHENMKIRINGHTDIGKENGSLEFLQKLSENRAKAVADYLISKGADKNNISWQGFANKKPIADNSTEAGKAQNRRVEVEIMEF